MLRRLIVATATIVVVTAAHAEPPFSAPVVNGAGATLSAAFGQRTNAAGDNVFHAGVDVAAPHGTAVHAPAAGRVMRVHAAGALGGYTGQVVEIDHGDGVRTRLSGLEGAELSPDAAINAGDVIGRIAARDDGVVAHLHIEVWRDGRVYDPAMQISLIAQAN
jgi:murein DD-endopeptidase MepM/ murein hydrolase activator NlpD